MEGLNPCPYCGGEVELIKLNKKSSKDKDLYRIECMRCRSLVAKGRGFKNESKEDAEKRIEQYNEHMRVYLYGK